jgi:hypothetical protein
MSSDWGEPREYRSDDRDLRDGDKRLVVSQGGNGDWYVSILNPGQKIGPTVRITTSGCPRGYEGVSLAIGDLYRALPPGRR